MILSAAGTKVLVATGKGTKTREPGTHTEILDLEDPSFHCEVGQYPTETFAANGAMIGQKPFVCGGSSSDGWGEIKSCYTLQENGEWTEDPVAILGHAGRSHAAVGNVVLHNELVIAGGKSHDKKIEMTSVNTAPRILDVEMPIGRGWSCAVRWDADTIFIIGGYNTLKDTYFVNISDNTIKEGPELPQGRQYHSCNEIKVNGEQYIVVTGGHPHDNLKSTILLSKSNFENGWQKSKH